MIKKYLFLIGFLFYLIFYMNANNLAYLSMNREIERIEVYINNSFCVQDDYIVSGERVFIYSKDLQSERTYVSSDFVFSDSFIKANHYYPDGYKYLYQNYFYFNRLLQIYEYEDFLHGISEKIFYFYNSDGNIIKETCSEYEKNYTYLSGNLFMIETIRNNGGYNIERVNHIDGTIVHTPCYDLYIKTDKKIIENKIDSGIRTETISYYLNDELFEEQIYVYENERVTNVKIDNKWRSDKFEYKFYYR